MHLVAELRINCYSMKTFNYVAKSVYRDNLVNIILSLMLILVPIVHPFGIKIGAARILDPFPTTVILVVAGHVLIIRVLMAIRHARLLAKAGGVITVDGGRITYPFAGRRKSEMRELLIADITAVSYDEDDGLLSVELTDGSEVVFDLDLFDNLTRFREFAALIHK